MKTTISAKTFAIFFGVIIIATTVQAVVEISFSSWSGLTRVSTDIIIARCVRTPDPEQDHGFGSTGSLFNSQIEVISFLKRTNDWATGRLKTNQLGSARLSSDFCPRQGEYYLIFSRYIYGEYQSSEAYKVIPLGLTFSTNSLSGRTLDEQIQMLLQRRLNNLNRQMKLDVEEKHRLEAGLTNGSK